MISKIQRGLGGIDQGRGVIDGWFMMNEFFIDDILIFQVVSESGFKFLNEFAITMLNTRAKVCVGWFFKVALFQFRNSAEIYILKIVFEVRINFFSMG